MKRSLARMLSLFVALLLLFALTSCDPIAQIKSWLEDDPATPPATPPDGTTPVEGMPAMPTAARIDGAMQVRFIDVGQADSELIVTPGGKAILIDAGVEPDGKAVLDCLSAMGITELEYAIFTHPDADHIGGAAKVLQSVPAKNVLLSDCEKNTKTYEDLLLAILDNPNTKLTVFVPSLPQNAGAGYSDQRSYVLDGVSFTILAPNSAEYESDNDYSIVLRVVYGSTSFLFTGDATTKSEGEILSRYSEADLKSDILKVGHHGSNTSSGKKFLEAVDPSFAVICCGTGNKYGHPTSKILERYAACNIPLFRTDLHGTIAMQSDGNAITLVQ